MARWQRALTIVRKHVAEGDRVLDVGCGVGFATAGLARHYDAYGLDLSRDYIGRAKARVPAAHFAVGSAEHLPYPDAYFAAVVMLEVLLYVRNQRAAIAEIARVLRPGGILVLSVPNTGLLRWFDSTNQYAWLTGENPLAPPRAPVAGYTYSRHYPIEALTDLLGEQFMINYVHYSALGLTEPVHLASLLLAKRLLRSRALYVALVLIYIGAYTVEDLIPCNKAGYHLMIAAQRTRCVSVT